jgi:hypothetical protein
MHKRYMQTHEYVYCFTQILTPAFPLHICLFVTLPASRDQLKGSYYLSNYDIPISISQANSRSFSCYNNCTFLLPN